MRSWRLRSVPLSAKIMHRGRTRGVACEGASGSLAVIACVAAVVLAGASLAARADEERTGRREGEPDDVVVGRAGGRRREDVARADGQAVRARSTRTSRSRRCCRRRTGSFPRSRPPRPRRRALTSSTSGAASGRSRTRGRAHTKPVSDYIPASELKHYLNTGEDTYDGQGVDGAAGTSSPRSRSSTARTCSRGPASRRRRRGRSCSRPATS